MFPRPQPATAYSKETKKMLDSMMSASGLPLAEQRRMRAACAAGPSASLGVRRNRQAAALASSNHQYEDLLRGVPINPRMALPGTHRRTQAQIIAENGGSMDREQFRGGAPTRDRTVQKTQLQQRMEFGRVLPEVSSSDAPAKPTSAPKTYSAEDELRHSIMAEVEERQQFIATMRQMGKGAEHEEAIQGQIAERLRDLRRIDALAKADDES